MFTFAFTYIKPINLLLLTEPYTNFSVKQSIIHIIFMSLSSVYVVVAQCQIYLTVVYQIIEWVFLGPGLAVTPFRPYILNLDIDIGLRTEFGMLHHSRDLIKMLCSGCDKGWVMVEGIPGRLHQDSIRRWQSFRSTLILPFIYTREVILFLICDCANIYW